MELIVSTVYFLTVLLEYMQLDCTIREYFSKARLNVTIHDKNCISCAQHIHMYTDTILQEVTNLIDTPKAKWDFEKYYKLN